MHALRVVVYDAKLETHTGLWRVCSLCAGTAPWSSNPGCICPWPRSLEVVLVAVTPTGRPQLSCVAVAQMLPGTCSDRAAGCGLLGVCNLCTVNVCGNTQHCDHLVRTLGKEARAAGGRQHCGSRPRAAPCASWGSGIRWCWWRCWGWQWRGYRDCVDRVSDDDCQRRGGHRWRRGSGCISGSR